MGVLMDIITVIAVVYNVGVIMFFTMLPYMDTRVIKRRCTKQKGE